MHKQCSDTQGSSAMMWAQAGHKGCISTGTDACIGGTVKARARHVIDRGGR
jgi:hypothetical protein